MRKKAEQESPEYSHKPMQKRVIGGFVITILLIVGISVVSFRSLSQLKNLVRIIDNPDQVNTELYELMNLLTEEELLLKDFFATRNKDRLMTFELLKDSVNQKVNRLAYYLKPDTIALKRLIELNRLIDKKHQLFNNWFRYYADDTLQSDYFQILARVDSLKNKVDSERVALTSQSTTDDTSQNRIKTFFDRLSNAMHSEERVDSSWMRQDSIYMSLLREISGLESVINHEIAKSRAIGKELQRTEESLFQQNFLLTTEIRTIIKKIVLTGEVREARQKRMADNQFVRETKIVGAIIIITLFLIALLMFIILKDLKHIEKRKNALILEKNSATKLAEMKSRFLSNMSHEIRTPLTSIIGYAEQLKNKLNDQNNREFVDIIYKSSEHLLFLVNEVLTFSRLEAGKIKLNIETFNIQDTLEDVYEILQLKARQKQLDFKLHADVSYLVLGDSLRLKQVFINLISNAIKFTDEGRVEFGVFIENEDKEKLHLRFFVKDTGIGIPEDKLKYVFEEFNQAYKESYGKYGGTGLGLSICKQLVNLHGGTIDIYSKPNEGTEIVFEITYQRGQEEDQKPLKEKVAVRNVDVKPENTSILIIDDDEFNAMLGKQILADHGFQVDVAHTGNEGLEKINENSYHLLLLDINLPDINGFEVITALHKKSNGLTNGNSLRVVALSANALNLPEEKLKKYGFAGKFIKPFHANELIQFVTDQVQIKYSQEHT